MAWTNIPNAALLIDKPWSSPLAMGMRDNPIAIAEGAPGAPGVRVGALQRLAPGDQVRSRLDALMVASGHSFAFSQAGTIRVTFEHRHELNGGGSGVVTRTRNGVGTVLATFANTGAFVARSVDCPVLPGDRIRIENIGGSATGNHELKNQRFQTNGQDLWPGAEAYLEGNTYA
jgi:hypothetical protein